MMRQMLAREQHEPLLHVASTDWMSRDAGMVILPAYYAASLANDEQQIVQYYVDICKASPVRRSMLQPWWIVNGQAQIPILLYNFPANAAGLDMSSDVIEQIMLRAPNLCGVKLTSVPTYRDAWLTNKLRCG
jgi:4-hydroxy-2-oxoglutarate aldolase